MIFKCSTKKTAKRDKHEEEIEKFFAVNYRCILCRNISFVHLDDEKEIDLIFMLRYPRGMLMMMTANVT